MFVIFFFCLLQADDVLSWPLVSLEFASSKEITPSSTCGILPLDP